MKKFILALMTMTALGLAGCQAKPDTQAIKNEMSSAITAKEYSQAAGLNQAILKLDKADAAASKRAKQFTQLHKAQTQFDKHQFATAKASAAKVGAGDQQLSQAAAALAAKATTRAQQQATLKKQISAAVQLRDSDPSAAQAKLKTILAGQTIKLPAFRSQRIKALQLQNELLTNSVSSQSASSNSSTDTNAASSSSTATTDSTASSASSQPESQQVSGSEAITDSDIAKARQEIKAAGEDPTYFSDNDIRNAIMKAHAAGRTEVQASDWQ